ncbi:hypothetical protein Tco_0677962 [Tanacetum coccineum]|uniref:Uncharacterized protein n=1 Tax=Tanacetum coccineum TaxID=301880 RepID=A0ABQ4XEL2_9ASTR
MSSACDTENYNVSPLSDSYPSLQPTAPTAEFPEASSTHTTSIHIKRYGHGVGHAGKTNVITAEKINALICGFLVHFFNHMGKEISCENLKSKTTEDIISIGSFIEVLVLNQYVIVRKILTGYQKEARGKRGLVTAQSNANLSPLARFLLSRWQGQASRDLNPR